MACGLMCLLTFLWTFSAASFMSTAAARASLDCQTARFTTSLRPQEKGLHWVTTWPCWKRGDVDVLTFSLYFLAAVSATASFSFSASSYSHHYTDKPGNTRRHVRQCILDSSRHRGGVSTCCSRSFALAWVASASCCAMAFCRLSSAA